MRAFIKIVNKRNRTSRKLQQETETQGFFLPYSVIGSFGCPAWQIHTTIDATLMFRLFRNKNRFNILRFMFSVRRGRWADDKDVIAFEP